MPSDDITQKLKELDATREKLQKQLAEASAVLSSVEQKISDLNERQQARMRSDIRIDNSIADQIAQGTSSSSRETPLPKLQAGKPMRVSKEDAPIRLVPQGLTDEDITIRPGERFTDTPLLYMNTLETTPAAACLKTRDGLYVYTNMTVREIFRMPEGLDGKKDFDVMPQPQCDVIRDTDASIFDSGTPTYFKEEIALPDGRLSYWFVHKFLVQGKNEIYLASLGVLVTDLVHKLSHEDAWARALQRMQKIEYLKEQLLETASQL